MVARQVVPKICSVLAVSLVVACGSGDDGTAEPTDATPSEPTEVVEDPPAGDETPSDTEESSADAEPSEDAAPAGDADGTPAMGERTATLTLGNGESYEFEVLCGLEPQMAAGSEILFTATSYDDPSLDVTQFGDEAPLPGLATVTVYDATTYESLWGASSLHEPFGGSLELSLNGSVISGTGTFFAGDDPVGSPDGVDGDLVVNC